MIRISQLKLPICHSEDDLKQKITQSLRLEAGLPFTYMIRRQSLDARHKEEKKFVYTVDVELSGETKILRKIHNNNISRIKNETYHFPLPGTERLRHRPVIIGSGPAGIFCGWYLARAGYRPLILERGEDALTRQQKVEKFWQSGVLDPDCNVQFGEGGAGTFSDGKLNTLVKDPIGRNHEVLLRFVETGAPSEILYQQKPHLGTDVLVNIVQNLRHQIEDMGGEVRFGAMVTDLRFEKDALQAVIVNREEMIHAQVCVLAIGHSARDTFEMLHQRQVPMTAKSFAVGVRIEHPQSMINQALYGEEENEILGAAAYKVTHTCENSGRGVYSFCMCPGGYVVNASTEPDRLAVNGMSYQARDSRNANSALIVTVNPSDFPEEGPLGGIAFQRELEKAAFLEGKGKIPVQQFADFCDNRISSTFKEVTPCMKGDYSPGNLRNIFPEFISESLIEGIQAFGKKIKGYDRADALLSGVESRTSSPVRIVRNENLISEKYEGLYPCGEGAGYAGGITSAAMDGIKIAETIAARYSPVEF